MRETDAVAVAVRHFESSTGQSAHTGTGTGKVIGQEERGLAVRVCYGHRRPPQRAWYLVGSEGAVIAELSLDEVSRFGERPWR